jgi:hypothetical protein
LAAVIFVLTEQSEKLANSELMQDPLVIFVPPTSSATIHRNAAMKATSPGFLPPYFITLEIPIL